MCFTPVILFPLISPRLTIAVCLHVLGAQWSHLRGCTVAVYITPQYSSELLYTCVAGRAMYMGGSALILSRIYNLFRDHWPHRGYKPVQCATSPAECEGDKTGSKQKLAWYKDG